MYMPPYGTFSCISALPPSLARPPPYSYFPYLYPVHGRAGRGAGALFNSHSKGRIAVCTVFRVRPSHWGFVVLPSVPTCVFFGKSNVHWMALDAQEKTQLWKAKFIGTPNSI